MRWAKGPGNVLQIISGGPPPRAGFSIACNHYAGGRPEYVHTTAHSALVAEQGRPCALEYLPGGVLSTHADGLPRMAAISVAKLRRRYRRRRPAVPSRASLGSVES